MIGSRSDLDVSEGNLNFSLKTNGTNGHGTISNGSNELEIKSEFIPDLVPKTERRASPDRDDNNETNFMEQSNELLNAELGVEEPAQLLRNIAETVSCQSCEAVKADVSLLKNIKSEPNVRDGESGEHVDTNADFGDTEPTNNEVCEKSLNESHRQPNAYQSPIKLKEVSVVLEKLDQKKLEVITPEQATLQCTRIYNSEKLKECTQEQFHMKDLFKSKHQNNSTIETVAEITNDFKQYYCHCCAMKFNVNIQLFSCPNCHETFNFCSRYESHYRRHSDELHPCLECCTKCKHCSSTHTHFRSQTEPILSCTHCPRQFNRKHGLTVHLRTHEDRPYACMNCALKFRNILGLRRHLRRVHSQKILFYPRPCPARFKEKKMLLYRLADHETGGRFSWDKSHSKKSCVESTRSSSLKKPSIKRHVKEKSLANGKNPTKRRKRVSKSHSVRHSNNKPCDGAKFKPASTSITNHETCYHRDRQCKGFLTRLFHSHALVQSDDMNVEMDFNESKYPCDKCKAEIDDDVDESILCEGGCFGRFHLQCAGLSETDFETIILLTGKVFWICETCENYRTTELMGLRQEKMELQTKLDDVQSDAGRLLIESKKSKVNPETLRRGNTDYVEDVKAEARRQFRVRMEVKADLLNMKTEVERSRSDKMEIAVKLENLMAENSRLLLKNSDLAANLEYLKVKGERSLMEIATNLGNLKAQKDKLLLENSELTANLENVNVKAERLLSEKMKIMETLENMRTENSRLLLENSEVTGKLKDANIKAERLLSDKMQIVVNLERMKAEKGRLLFENLEVTENLKSVREKAENLQEEKLKVNTELDIVKAEKKRLSCEVSGILRNTDLQQDCEKIKKDLRAENMSEREVRPVVIGQLQYS